MGLNLQGIKFCEGKSVLKSIKIMIKTNREMVVDTAREIIVAKVEFWMKWIR